MAVQYLRPSGTAIAVPARLTALYGWAIALPPAVALVPVAIAFLASVVHFSPGDLVRVVAAAAVVYGAGVLAFVVFVGRCARDVEEAIDTRRNASAVVSQCLASTELGALILWVGAGALLAAAGAYTYAPTLAGLQNFFEAAMIVAAPAMAWSYWTGKKMLLLMAGQVRIHYTGRPYSLGVKIAMVFIGFFGISLGALVQLISSHVAAQLTAAGLDAPAIASDITRYALLMALVTAVVFAVATFFLARDLTSPMNELIRVANEMASGHFDVDARVFADDEVGKLADRFGVTRDSLRSLLSNVGNSGAAITNGVRAMTAGTNALLSGAHEQKDLNQLATESVNAVGSEARSVLEAVDKVAAGSYDSAGSALELNASSTEVARRMDDLFRSVEKTSSSTTEIDATARETSHRTNELSGVGSEVLTFVTQMDASVAEITRTSHATADLSTQVRNDAAAAQQAVTATVEGIRSTQEATRRTAGAFEDLQNSLKKIDQIVLFIDSVTDETKLLSLNAAIIAAHAGEDDYGFSVIAEEVRQLSERTRTATAEIAGIIRGLQPVTKQAVVALGEGVGNVERTVDLAQQASASLEKIVGSSDRSRDMVQKIARSLEEQVMASRHLHDVTSRVSDTIREIHRANEGQAEATRLLAVEADHVKDIAKQVNRAADEQRIASGSIAKSMEQIATDVKMIRDRLERQLAQADQIANASKTTLAIAQKNSSIADDFNRELESLFASASAFENEVARFRV